MKKRNLLKALLAATLVCATVSLAAEKATPKTTAVKGNAKSKIYHKPTCKYYTAKSTTVEFKTEAAAQKAGYKACKKCGKAKAEKKAEPKKTEPPKAK